MFIYSSPLHDLSYLLPFPASVPAHTMVCGNSPAGSFVAEEAVHKFEEETKKLEDYRTIGVNDGHDVTWKRIVEEKGVLIVE